MLRSDAHSYTFTSTSFLFTYAQLRLVNVENGDCTAILSPIYANFVVKAKFLSSTHDLLIFTKPVSRASKQGLFIDVFVHFLFFSDKSNLLATSISKQDISK